MTVYCFKQRRTDI